MATLLGGVTAGAAAIACSSADSGRGTKCRKNRARNIEIAGGAVAGAGLIALVAGLVSLNSRSQERDELDNQIRALQQKRSMLPTDLAAGVHFGEATTFTLSWSF